VCVCICAHEFMAKIEQRGLKFVYGVATVSSRIDKITGLFCKRGL